MADIVRTHHRDLLARWNHVLSREQRKALRDIRDCRSAALGGRLEQCDRCGHRVILYNSCRNRHCPKCQAQARARWLAQREAEVLPVSYFHVVFTLPSQIGRLALQNPRQIYKILFRCASQTLLEAAADPRLLGASIGFLAVLHTWGQNLHLHPHLHCVVPGGGISLDASRWIGCKKSSFFLPVRLLSHHFRKSFLRSLKRAFSFDNLTQSWGWWRCWHLAISLCVLYELACLLIWHILSVSVGRLSTPLTFEGRSHFHLGSHSDRFAAPDCGFVPKLRPQRGLAELRVTSQRIVRHGTLRFRTARQLYPLGHSPVARSLRANLSSGVN
jgi:transposase-like zinc-binding protein/putative transposase